MCVLVEHLLTLNYTCKMSHRSRIEDLNVTGSLSTGEVLEWDGNGWVPGSKSGVSFFSAPGTAQAVGATSTVDIVWDTPTLTTSDISSTSTELTINTAGILEINYGTEYDAGASIIETKLQINTGGGYVDVPGTVVGDGVTAGYGRVSRTALIDVSVGDKLKAVIQNFSGSPGSLQADGTILNAKLYL